MYFVAGPLTLFLSLLHDDSSGGPAWKEHFFVPPWGSPHTALPVCG